MKNLISLLSILFTELNLLALALSLMATCQADRMNHLAPPKPFIPVRHYPNVLETMPVIALSAMDELELMVKKEVDEKAKEFAKR